MSEHTKEPWAYRPHEDDDWGIVRAPVTEQGQWLGGIICQARDPERLGESDLAACRAAKVDPWEANARRIVECVNALAGMNPAALAGLIEAVEEAREIFQLLSADLAAYDDPDVHAQRIAVLELKEAEMSLALAKLRETPDA